MKLVSVIIPSFNRAHLIVKTLESVLTQTYSPIEIIVVDNGSTDNTLDVLATFGNKISVYHEPQAGMGGSYARNKGISVAKGDYIAFLDSDDYWHPTKIELQMKLLSSSPELAWCYTDQAFFDGETGESTYKQSDRHILREGDVLKFLFIENFISSITPVIRADVFQEVGLFYPLPKSTDWDMMLRIAAIYPVGLVPEVLAFVRRHTDNVTTKTKGRKAVESVVEVIERTVAKNKELEPLKPASLANAYIANGLLLTKTDNLQEARQSFQQAIALQPKQWTPYVYWLSTFAPKSAIKWAVSFRRSRWENGEQ